MDGPLPTLIKNVQHSLLRPQKIELKSKETFLGPYQNYIIEIFYKNRPKAIFEKIRHYSYMIGPTRLVCMNDWHCVKYLNFS